LDVKLGLGPENLSPVLVKKVVRQGGKEAFAEGSADLHENAELTVAGKQVQRITKRVGHEWAAIRDREVEAFKRGELPRLYTGRPQAAALMVDGGRLLVRAEEAGPGVHQPQWRTPRYACCLTLQSKPSAQDPQPEPPTKFLDPERVRKVVQEIQSRGNMPVARKVAQPAAASQASRRRKPCRLHKRPVRRLVRTVVATMSSAQDFAYMAAAEVYLRGMDRADRKGYVCDGELCNWTIWDEHFRAQGFVPILDFLHLLAHLYTAAQAAGGGTAKQWERYQRWLRWAWAGQRQELWLAVKAAAADAGSPPKNASDQDPRRILASAVTYLTNNLERMDYPRYRKLGLPYSSAPVESVVKQFNRRVKGTEKFWCESGAEAVLQVRAAYLSEDGRAQRYWSMPRPLYRAVGRNRLNFAA
jgi:hypothetical protein